MGLATIHPNLRAAFRERLLTCADPDFAANRVAWEGEEDFQPSSTTPYFSESFRAGPSERLSYGNPNGAGDVIGHPIEVSVTLFFPNGAGTAAIERCAGAIMALFRPATRLTHSGEGGVINNVARSAIYRDGHRIACAVTASLSAYTQN